VLDLFAIKKKNKMIDPKALQQVMRSRGYNMKSLSRAAGLGETYIRDLIIEKVKSPSYENLVKISAILDCSLDEITLRSDGEERVISRDSFDVAAKGLRAWESSRDQRLTEQQFARLLPLIAEQLDKRHFDLGALSQGSTELSGFYDDEDEAEKAYNPGPKKEKD
jgi:transcriptional regulator with XRE-family HTH domain